jgi:SAM-dependent methyltransferase
VRLCTTVSIRVVARSARSRFLSLDANQRQQDPTGNIRESSFGQHDYPAWRVWLRDRILLGSLFRHGRPYAGKRLADVGCGYRAPFTRTLLEQVSSATLVDVAIDPELKEQQRVTAIEGALPEVLRGVPSQSTDVLVCSAVLEHLWEPLETLKEFPRILAPGGVCLVNVPSWLGKRVLEFLAFRLGMSADEMDDHKNYYDPHDLWPLLVRAGFAPRNIKCYRQLARLNTLAVCRVD